MTEATPPTRRVDALIPGLAAVFLFLVIIFSAALINPRQFDFAALYTGGVIIRQPNRAKLYDLGEQARVQRQVLKRDQLLMYNHPPFEAVGFAVLTRLPYLEAYFLWGVINVFFWVCFQQVIRPHAPIPKKTNRYIWLCCLFMPLWYALGQGQTSVLLLLLFTLTYICLQRGRDFRAGIFLGLGLFKFAVVLPFALICFLRGKGKLLAGFFAAASLLGLVSIMAVGASGMRSYVDLLVDTVRRPDNPLYAVMRYEERMPTVKGFLATLLTGRVGTLYVSVLVAAISTFLVLFTAWRWRQEDRRGNGASSALMFAAALTVSQLVAPHFHAYDLSLMLLAVLLVIGARQWSQPSGQRTMLLTAMVVLYAPPVYVVLLAWKRMCDLAPVLVAFALAALRLARGNDSGEASHTVMLASRSERLRRLIGGKAEREGLFG